MKKDEKKRNLSMKGSKINCQGINVLNLENAFKNGIGADDMMWWFIIKLINAIVTWHHKMASVLWHVWFYASSHLISHCIFPHCIGKEKMNHRSETGTMVKIKEVNREVTWVERTIVNALRESSAQLFSCILSRACRSTLMWVNWINVYS